MKASMVFCPSSLSFLQATSMQKRQVRVLTVDLDCM